MTTLNMEDINLMADDWQLEQSLGLTLFDDPWKTVDLESSSLKTSVETTTTTTTTNTGNNDLNKLFGIPRTELADPFCEDWMENYRIAEMLQSLVEESENISAEIIDTQLEQALENGAVSEVKGHEILRSLIEQGLEEDVPSSPEAQVAPTIDLSPKSSLDSSMDCSVSTIELTDMDDIMQSPLSAEDVDSLLSGSEPASPQPSVETITKPSTSKCSELEAMLLDNSVRLNGKSRTRPSPYSKGGRSAKSKVKSASSTNVPVEFLSKKDKKKLQNKNAAIRYRHKKKQEAECVKGDENDLDSKNKELHEKVDQLSREIQYMKDLMAEVCKAKGVSKL